MHNEASNLIRTSRQGDLTIRKRRLSSLNLLCRALDTQGIKPKYLSQLTKHHIAKGFEVLIALNYSKKWLQTILDDMNFLIKIANLDILRLDYISFNISTPICAVRFDKIETKDIEKIHDPISRLLIELTLYFGINFNEAISIVPDIHVFDDYITLTREITSNSIDKGMPIKYESQVHALELLKAETSFLSSLKDHYDISILREKYKQALNFLGLSLNKSYKYFYALLRYTDMKGEITKKACIRLIANELAVCERTVKSYL